jgi:hypothetical protein
VWEERIVLEHRVDGTAIGGRVLDRLAENLELARRRLVEARDQPKTGCLARVRRPEHREELARDDVEVDACVSPPVACRRPSAGALATSWPSGTRTRTRARPPRGHSPVHPHRNGLALLSRRRRLKQLVLLFPSRDPQGKGAGPRPSLPVELAKLRHPTRRPRRTERTRRQ